MKKYIYSTIVLTSICIFLFFIKERDNISATKVPAGNKVKSSNDLSVPSLYENLPRIPRNPVTSTSESELPIPDIHELEIQIQKTFEIIESETDSIFENNSGLQYDVEEEVADLPILLD